jgi:hypothetical protein
MAPTDSTATVRKRIGKDVKIKTVSQVSHHITRLIRPLNENSNCDIGMRPRA